MTTTDEYAAAFCARVDAMTRRYPYETAPDRYGTDVHYVLGYLESAIVAMAEDHTRCRIKGCALCGELARVLATISNYHAATK